MGSANDPMPVSPIPAGDAVDAFLAMLDAELEVQPDDITARRHLAAVVAIAPAPRGRPAVPRWATVAAALAAVVGTTGVAFAGNLPAPIQSVVSDVAEVLPVPVKIPHPAVPPQRVFPTDEHPVVVETIPDEPQPPPEPEGVPHRREPSSSQREEESTPALRDRDAVPDCRADTGPSGDGCRFDLVPPPRWSDRGTGGERRWDGDRDRGEHSDRRWWSGEGGDRSGDSDRRDGDSQEGRDHDHSRDDESSHGEWGNHRRDDSLTRRST